MSDQRLKDTQYLQQALENAYISRGSCAPNPSVGAVIINPKGEVIGQGYHQGIGKPHAEIEALRSLSGDIKDATMYVTLEPCCHYGKTPPCTLALIASGIKRVVYAYRDPNPVVAGNGALQLNQAGIVCDYVQLDAIDEFYRSYTYWQQHKLPYVTAKIAMSLNGKIAGNNGEPLQITGADLNELTQQSRKNADAILTTARTILCDNPRLNARYNGKIYPKSIYILDRNLSINIDAQIFANAKKITLMHGRNYSSDKIRKFSSDLVHSIALGNAKSGLDLHDVLYEIGHDGVHDLWVEAGGRLLSALLKDNLVNRLIIYVAPIWIEAGPDAFVNEYLPNLAHEKMTWQQYGKDVMLDIKMERDR